jgi:hypothetical protein
MLHVICNTDLHKTNLSNSMQNIVIAIFGIGPTARGMMQLIYYSFNVRIQPFLNAPVLNAISSLTATYLLVISPYLTPVVKFTACSLDTSPEPGGHQCSTGAPWKAFWHGTEHLTRHETSVHRFITFHAH